MKPDDIERALRGMFMPAEFHRFLRGREAFDSRLVAELPHVLLSEAEYFGRVVLLLHQHGYFEDEDFYLDLLAIRRRCAEQIGRIATLFQRSDVAMTARVLAHASASPGRALAASVAAEPMGAQIRRLHAAIRSCSSMELAEGHAVAREIAALAGRVVDAPRAEMQREIVDVKPYGPISTEPLLDRVVLLKTIAWLIVVSTLALLGPILVGIQPSMVAPARVIETEEIDVRPSFLPVMTVSEPPRPVRSETRGTRARKARKVRTAATKVLAAGVTGAPARPQIPALPEKLAPDLVEQTLLKTLELGKLADFSVRLVVRPDGGVDQEQTRVSTVYGEEGAKVLGLPFPPTQRGSGALLCYVIDGTVKKVRCEAT